MTSKEKIVLDFIKQKGRCTSVQLAYLFGKCNDRSHCGYLTMLKRMEQKGMVVELNYHSDQRYFFLPSKNHKANIQLSLF